MAKHNSRDNDALINARVHGHLESGLKAVAVEMRSSFVAINSAALWHFLTKMTPRERGRR